MFSPKTQNIKPSSSNHSSQNSFIQPKLNVGKPGDKYEVEADRAADQIVAGGKENQTSSFFAPTVQKKNEDEIQKQETNKNEIQQKPLVDSISPVVQLKPESTIQKQEEEIQQKEEEEVQAKEEDEVQKTPEKEIQTKQESNESPLTGDLVQQKLEEDIQEKEEEEIQEKEEEEIQQLQMSGGDDNSSLESNLSSSKGGGSALPTNTKNEMESGFGADFSGVRVHNDSNAVQMNQELGSQAFTNGNDIYFNEGKYNPESDSGKHLLAHELTHTVQQGASPTNSVQKSEGEGENTTLVAPTQAQDITNGLQLSDDWLAYIEQESRTRDFDVAVKIGERFTGTIKIRKLGRPAEGETQKFELASTRRNNSLDVGGMEFLNPLRNAGIFPVLVLNSFGEEQNTTGFLSVRVGEDVVPDVLGIIQKINENLEAMSFLGLSPIEVAEGLENRFESGGLNFRANNLSADIDGYIEATGSLGITDSAMTFELNSTVDVAGLASGEFNVARGADGKLSGQANIAADIANISASLNIEYDDGAVTIQGTGRMNSDKFSGEITLLVTDAARSTQMMHAALGVESMEQEAEAPAQEQAAVPKTKNNQVLAGWGEVTASITPWLEGTAKIGIDNEGHVTIVGEIIVPDEIELMEQRGKKVDIFEVEIRAGYGIPLVGQVFLFASIGMFANAGFGPLVLKDVGFTGTYSTDPNVLQEFSITGTLGINAFAVLGLEAEAGVGVTILGHDVKAGVNVTAAAGLRAYAEATPTFEYKEEQSPQGGKVGESRLKGHFEAAAQLFLQLSGALFYELDSPWWSPAPDGREEYPLGEVQYPIGDSLGIGADVDWLVGGEEPPELTFSPVEFDPDKFTADVMADPPPRSMGDSESNPAGDWQGENAPGDQNENPEITGEGEGLPPGRREEDLENLPDEQKYMRALDELSQMENANPKPTIGDVEDKINTVKRRYGIRRIDTRNEEAESVNIFVQHGEQDNGRHLLEIQLMSEAEKLRILAEAVADLRTRERRVVNEEDRMEESAAEDMLNTWKREHPVVQTTRIVDGQDTWDYFVDIGSRQDTERGKPKAGDANSEGLDLQQGDGEIGKVVTFTGGGENHRLWIRVSGNTVDVMVASVQMTLSERLSDWDIRKNGLDPVNKRAAQGLLDSVNYLYDSTKSEAEIAKTEQEELELNPTQENSQQAIDADDRVEGSEERLKRLVGRLFDIFEGGVEFTEKTFGVSLEGGNETITLKGGGRQSSDILHVEVYSGNKTINELFTDFSVGPVGNAIHAHGVNSLTRIGESIQSDIDELREITINDGKVLSPNVFIINAKGERIANRLSTIGNEFKANSFERLTEIAPLDPRVVVTFSHGLDRNQVILDEYQRQLNEQAVGINAITIDQWMLNRNAYSLDESVFEDLDQDQRDVLLQELQRRATEAEAIGGRRTAKYRLAIAAIQEAIDNFDDPDFDPDFSDISAVSGRFGNEGKWKRRNMAGFREIRRQLRALDVDNTGIFRRLAILHNADQIAGGFGMIPILDEIPDKPADDASNEEWNEYIESIRRYVGSASVNSSIGSLWKDNIEVIVNAVDDYPRPSWGIWRMNVELNS